MAYICRDDNNEVLIDSTKIFYVLKRSLLLCFIAVSHPVLAQHEENVEEEIVIQEGVIATEKYKQLIFDTDSTVRQGPFTLRTRIIDPMPQSEYVLYSFDGSYLNDKRDGRWSYEMQKLNLSIEGISSFKANMRLEGLHTLLKGNHSKGLMSGKWNMELSEVSGGRKKAAYAMAQMSFQNGIGTGGFIYDNRSATQNERISGQFDAEGNLDGKWQFRYTEGDIAIIEYREYAEGFLFHLEKREQKTDTLIERIAYNDVIVKFRASTDTSAEVGTMVKGEKRFDFHFNNGYREDDRKLRAQDGGNAVLQSIIDLIKAQSGLINLRGRGIEIQMASTRRFRFLYENNEDSIANLLHAAIKKEIAAADSLRNSPSLRINRIKDDSIATFYHFLPIYKTRLEEIDSSLNYITSGKFDYEFRDNYFKKGMLSTCRVDTIKFTFDGDKIMIPFGIEKCVKRPESLLSQIETYVDALIDWKKSYLSDIEPKLLLYAKFARIEDFDKRILTLKDSMETVYLGVPITELSDMLYKKVKTDMDEFTGSIYERFGFEKLNMLLKEYTEEADPNVKIEIGSRIERLLENLIAIEEDVRRVNDIPRRLDVAYTRYSPNPFFPRDIESRVKQHIYSRGAEVVFPKLIRDINRSNSIAEVRAGLNMIFALEERMLELAEREDEDVNRLNSRMRRESQPERIKRLMGLDI